MLSLWSSIGGAGRVGNGRRADGGFSGDVASAGAAAGPLGDLYAADAEGIGTEEYEGFGSLGGWALWAVAAAVGYGVYAFRGEHLRKKLDEQGASGGVPSPVLWLGDKYVSWREGLDRQVDKYTLPSSDQLLPDLPEEAKSYTRTLVLDLDEVLMHSKWTRDLGWRVYKRPGAEKFLQHLAQYYEIVIYTHQLYTYADPILERLDTGNGVSFRLYKDSCLWKEGKNMRDLACLNRDPKMVLFLTADPSLSTLEENVLELGKWENNSEDTTLADITPLLEAIVRNQVADVRDVARSYKGQDVAIEYKARTRRVAEQRSLKGGIGRRW